ncbi:hypothetical protein DelCs14_1826 [Delftia sp. Cs1-4]|uniref:hypothetical protein n=1 Tax=Delftia sp. (strain Cs1-4) TaxID=742013 RepID=UPI00020E7E63|nr:hypothetical protein [Delftia sp. Cs1-4]AEF88849.1 hypothetical protein DelCs14_1826 [Delftia sp. Cs1-4]
MNIKDWRVRVARDGGMVDLGKVSEASESLARCAALSRYGVSDEELALGEVRPRGASIYPDEDFEVSPMA